MSKRKKRLKSIAITLTAGFLVGFFMSFFFYHLNIDEFIDSLTYYAWYFNILFALAAVVVVIAVHELGHFVALRVRKIKVRAIYVLCFTFVKHKKIFVPGILLRFILMIGGVVMPQIPDFKTEAEYQTLRKKLSIAIKRGPQVSLGFAIITVIGLIIAIILKDFAFLGFMWYFTVVVILLTILVFMASKVSYKGMYGDFVATKKIINDDEFALSYITSALNSSNNIQDLYPILWPKVINVLSTAVLTKTQTINLLTFYLDHIIFDEAIGAHHINLRLDYLRPLTKVSEEAIILNGYLALYHYYFANEVEYRQFYEVLNKFENKKLSKVILFWQNYVAYLTNQNNNKEFLMDKKNYHPSSNEWIFKPLKEPIEMPVPIKDNLSNKNYDIITNVNEGVQNDEK
jgi:hypothetical protein